VSWIPGVPGVCGCSSCSGIALVAPLPTNCRAAGVGCGGSLNPVVGSSPPWHRTRGLLSTARHRPEKAKGHVCWCTAQHPSGEPPPPARTTGVHIAARWAYTPCSAVRACRGHGGGQWAAANGAGTGVSAVTVSGGGLPTEHCTVRQALDRYAANAGGRIVPIPRGGESVSFPCVRGRLSIPTREIRRTLPPSGDRPVSLVRPRPEFFWLL